MDIKGLRKIGQGEQSEIFLLDKNRVLKLAINDINSETMLREMEIMKAMETTDIRVPKTYEYVELEGRSGYIMERINGETLLDSSKKRPWLVNFYAKRHARFHQMIHRIKPPANLPLLNQEMRKFFEQASYLPDYLKEFVLGILKSLPQKETLLHCGFHPANVMIEKKKPVIIDWGSCAIGDYIADVANTVLILSNSNPPSNLSGFYKKLLTFMRKSYLKTYLDTYFKDKNFDRDLLNKWQIVFAAYRMYYIGEEQAAVFRNFLNREYLAYNHS